MLATLVFNIILDKVTHLLEGCEPSLTKILPPLVCFKPLILENGKRYGKKAFYEIDI